MRRQRSETTRALGLLRDWRRRGVLQLLAGAGAVAVAGGPTLLFGRDAGAQAIAPPAALPIPPLLSPPLQDGLRTFNLTLQTGRLTFEPGFPASTLGINGPYLGPTLRATQGDTVTFNVTNQIGQPTTLHWHGMHLPPTMDGGPHQEIAPGATWQPTFTIRQQAATLWYHSHMLGFARPQVSRGLASMFILDDGSPAQAALPHDYGVDDIPVILQAYLFGNTQTLVNGALVPTLVTEQPRLRLRLLNASDQQIYSLGFAGDVPFDQVASDGGLLNAPVRLTRLQLGPAERAEIVVDLPQTPIVLQRFDDFGGPDGGGDRSGTAIPGADRTLLTIQPSANGAAQPAGLAPLPAQLNTIERLDLTSAVVTRQMVLGSNGRARTINGQNMSSMADMMDMSSAFRVRLGDVERWNVVNTSRDTHLFHIHDLQFQILERNGVPPGPNELGRKDTVLVRPNETVPLLLRFTDYADSDTPYMYHCHILEHEDQGMMGQFFVVPA